LPSNSPHDHMILRAYLVGSHGSWKRPRLQTPSPYQPGTPPVWGCHQLPQHSSTHASLSVSPSLSPLTVLSPPPSLSVSPSLSPLTVLSPPPSLSAVREALGGVCATRHHGAAAGQAGGRVPGEPVHQPGLHLRPPGDHEPAGEEPPLHPRPHRGALASPHTDSFGATSGVRRGATENGR
jgi:hypothetical protein